MTNYAEQVAPHPVCADMDCVWHGVAACNARQSRFYAENDRTREATG